MNKNQKVLGKMAWSKTICPKWHFGQVGQGDKRTMASFLLIFLVKTMISYSGNFHYNLHI